MLDLPVPGGGHTKTAEVQSVVQTTALDPTRHLADFCCRQHEWKLTIVHLHTLTHIVRIQSWLLIPLTHALIVLTVSELNDEIKYSFHRRNTSNTPAGHLKQNTADRTVLFFTPVYSLFILPTHTTPCSGKSKGHHRQNIPLLTHYIMRSHFFIALMHGCSHSPAERCRLHACATCFMCCDDGAS